MSLSRWALLLVLVTLCPDRELASETQVRVEGGRVIVQATGTPLTEVLSRFSEATGTQVVYEKGGKPHQPVTVEIDAASAAEALSQLLEGQGLSYALRLDPSGRGVEMLFLAAKGKGPTAPSSTGAVERAVPIDPPEMEPSRSPEIESGSSEPSMVEETKEQPVDPITGEPPLVSGRVHAPSGASAPGGTPSSFPWQPAIPSYPGPASYPVWR